MNTVMNVFKYEEFFREWVAVKLLYKVWVLFILAVLVLNVAFILSLVCFDDGHCLLSD